MKCPVCKTVVKSIGIHTSEHLTTFRLYQCDPCKIQFRTEERIKFESLPHDVKENFIMNGRLKRL